MKELLTKLDSIEARLFTSKQILTSEEAARFLDIEKSYLYKLTSAGIVPYSKPNGKKIYFSKADLENWALGNKSQGNSERNIQAATYCSITNH
jgi:excisionase family DNA binding protein